MELLNKLGNGTACVFVRGEAAISVQYTSVNVPATTRLDFDTSVGPLSVGLSTTAHAFSYPASTVYIGVSPRAQIAITPPSFVRVNSSVAAALTGNDVLAAGASNIGLEYKQLVYVNPKSGTMFAIDLAYIAPTGSPALRGSGPQYTIDPILTQPLPHNFGVTVALPVNNLMTGSPARRVWTWTPQIVPYWTSPGGTQLAVFVQHGFNPNVTLVLFSGTQLIGRHVAISVAQGGFTATTHSAGPLGNLLSASTTVRPSLISVGVNYLFGHSNLPGQ